MITYTGLISEITKQPYEGKIVAQSSLYDGEKYVVTDLGKRPEQDRYMMYVLDGKNKIVKEWGTHPALKGAIKFAKNRGYEVKQGMNEDTDDLQEAMQPDEMMSSAEDAINYFNTEMSKLFPQNDYVAEASMFMHSIKYQFSDKYWKVTIQNSPTHISHMMHLTDNFGRTVAMDKFPIELNIMAREAKANGVNYRKINGKSPMESTKKLVAWFKKNKDKILEIQVKK